MLPPPCFTVGTVFFGLKVSPFLCQIKSASMCIRPKEKLISIFKMCMSQLQPGLDVALHKQGHLNEKSAQQSWNKSRRSQSHLQTSLSVLLFKVLKILPLTTSKFVFKTELVYLYFATMQHSVAMNVRNGSIALPLQMSIHILLSSRLIHLLFWHSVITSN